MANADTPMGFRPYGEVKQAMVLVAGSEIFKGDAIRLASDGQIDAVTAGTTIMGVALQYAAAAGDSCLCSVHPDQLYVGQCDETEFDNANDVGLVGDIVATAGSSTYKISRHEVDSSTLNTGGTAQVTVLGLVPRSDNAVGGFADVIFKINEHQVFGDEDFAGI